MPDTNEIGIAILHEVLGEFRKELDQFRDDHRELIQAIHSLVEAINAPSTRTCRLNYPEGPVTMTIKDFR